MLDEDLTQLFEHEPLADVWLQASREYFACVEGKTCYAPEGDIIHVCGVYTVGQRYCTRRPGHAGQHVSGAGEDMRATAKIWDAE